MVGSPVCRQYKSYIVGFVNSTPSRMRRQQSFVVGFVNPSIQHPQECVVSRVNTRKQGCVVGFVQGGATGFVNPDLRILLRHLTSRRWTLLAPTADVAGDHDGGGSAPLIYGSGWRRWL
nr:hypothetical protein Iba_scaffold45145CG0010 [Ipomoea batatas]